MIGTGRELEERKKMAGELKLNNVEFVPPVPFSRIPEYMAKAAVCLGIVGDTEKTQLVIPFKVYEALEAARPVITADTPAIRELLTHKKDVYLCKAADAGSLADAIQVLKNDKILRNTIARNGHTTFQEKCSPAVIGRDIKEMTQELIKNK